MEVFISYSSKDKDKARLLGANLRRDGFTVWRDREGLNPGGQFQIELEQALRRADVVLALFSKASYESEWVRNELLFAKDNRKVIVPLMLESGVNLFLAHYGTQYVIMYEDWDSGYLELKTRLNELNAELATESAGDNPSTYAPKVDQPHPEPTSEADMLTSDDDPFWFGSAVPTELFQGRVAALERIQSAIVGQYNKVRSISVLGNRRIGKTSLLNYVVASHRVFLPASCKRVFVYLDMTDARAREIPDLMRVLRRGITRQMGQEPWNEHVDGSLSHLADAIEMLASKRTSLVLCLDEWETTMAHPELDKLLEELRAQASEGKLCMIIATAHTLIDLTQQAHIGSPFYNIFEEITLERMPREEWTKIIEKGFAVGGGQIAWSEASEIMSLAEKLGGGHPYLTQLAGSMIWRGRRKHWTIEEVSENYMKQARNVFSWMLQTLSSEQLTGLRAAAGLTAKGVVSENTWLGLIARGLVTESRELFCQPFIRYVTDELR